MSTGSLGVNASAETQGELPLAAATAPCGLDVEDVWEARVFASMCVATYQVTTPRISLRALRFCDADVPLTSSGRLRTSRCGSWRPGS